MSFKIVEMMIVTWRQLSKVKDFFRGYYEKFQIKCFVEKISILLFLLFLFFLPWLKKKCVPCKDLARFSFKVLQDNAFFCKTSCKNLARKNISLQDSSKEKNFVEGSRQFFKFFIFIVFDFKLTTAS